MKDIRALLMVIFSILLVNGGFLAAEESAPQGISPENAAYITGIQSEIEQAKEIIAFLESEMQEKTISGQQLESIQSEMVRVKKQEIDTLEKIVAALSDGDTEQLEELEETREGLAYEYTLNSLKKEMLLVIRELDDKTNQYPDDESLKQHNAEVRRTFAQLIKAHMDLYKNTVTLKRTYQEKDRVLKLYHTYIETLQQ
ncbi:MAG: hypothetical protein C4541_06480 [Candidatus Auribacter fodinae]|jgi:hypothetical protein|uniref:Uncharacterized protein n=1 Tax=Candidatus Auribacter fodinae TaxID=2093366 RepID=A0A3A4QZE5_9BACT|nr:MAG: hypothetical protein C4541_06480 [Candidatus Auribacter fodinae]